MNKKTLIALAVIAVGLFAYIGLVERGSLSTGELSGREARLLPRFVRDRVEGVLLVHGSTRIRLTRARAEEGELGEWRLVEPIEALADQEAVASLLGSLDWADARRELGPASESDLATWGLSTPRAEVTLSVADETLSLALGGSAATGDGVYARVGQNDAAIVGQDLLEALTADVGHFRDKSLFHGVAIAELQSFRLQRADATPPVDLAFEAEGPRIWINGDTRLLASADRVRETARAVSGLRARRFADDVSATDAGLDSPSMEFTLVSGDPAVSHALVVGGPCADHVDERYARADDSGVVCVAANDLGGFERPIEAYRQARLTTLTADELAGVEVQVGGHTLTLAHSDDGYHYTAQPGGQGVADEAAVGEWLAAVSRMTPLELVPATQDELAGYGLADAHDSVTLSGNGDDVPDDVLHFGMVTPDGVWLRRGDEQAAVRVCTDDATRLALDALTLRSRELVRERETSVAAVTLRRDGVEERLARVDGLWQVTAPVALRADGTRVSNLARQLARLDALRFVAPSAEQGLSHPRYELLVRYEGAPLGDGEDGDTPPVAATEAAPRQHRLRLGASAPDGVYARLDDEPSVFLLPLSWLEDLAQPFVSRDLLRTSPSEVSDLTLTRGGETLSLHYDGMAWQTGTGVADGERTDALLEAIHGLRAEHIERFLPAPAPMEAPAIRLSITRAPGADAPQRYVVDIAAAAPGAERAPRLARREDLAVAMTVPAAAVQTLMQYRP